jgi:hypothetical protein
MEHRLGIDLDMAGTILFAPSAATPHLFSQFKLSGNMKMCKRLHGPAGDRTIG